MRYLKFVYVLLLLSPLAMADSIILKNGDRMTGTVDSISGGRVLLNTDYAGAVTIKLEAIAELTTESTFEVTSTQGRFNGRFAIEEGQQILAGQQDPVEVELKSVKAAGQNKLGLAVLVPEWSSRADLSAALSNGNTDTEQYSALIESILKKESVQHSLSLLIADESAEEETTRDELDLDYLYKRFLSEKWYASGNAEYFEDQLKDVDSRITLGGGMGYQFWEDSFGSLSTDLGLSYVREDIDGDQESNPAVRWGLEYRRFLFSKKMETFHKQSVLFIPDADRGEVLESSTGVRYALNSRIDATARVDVNHETEPAPGNSRTDVSYNLGVGIKF